MENDEIRDDETLEETIEAEEAKGEESDEEAEENDTEAELIKLKAINARLRKKLEAKGGDKPLPTKAKPEDDGDVRKDIESLKLSEKKRQFGYEHSLSPDEVDFVARFDSSLSPETLQDDAIKAGLQALRRKKRVEDNTPSSSAKSSVVTTKKFKELSASEKNAEWQKYMKSKGVIR